MPSEFPVTTSALLDGEELVLSPRKIETKRLVARISRPTDAAILAKLMTERISKWVAAWPYPLDEAHSVALLKAALEGHEAGACFPFVLIEKKTQLLIGWLKIDMTECEIPTVELGYWIGETFQRRGYAEEIARAAICFAFCDLQTERVMAGAQIANHASLRLLGKLGMKRSHEEEVWAPARQRLERCEFWEINRLE